MKTRTITATLDNIINGLRIAKDEKIKLCAIYMKKDNLTAEEKRANIDRVIESNHDEISSANTIMSTLMITVADKPNFEKMNELTRVLYDELWISVLDIDGYYEI